MQDVAVTLSYGRQREGYAMWKDVFKQGYSSIRSWPIDGEKIIETLIAARSVMFINYVARIDSSPEEYIDRRCKELQEFLNVYG